MDIDFGQPNEHQYRCANCGESIPSEDTDPRGFDRVVRVQQGGSDSPTGFYAWWFCDLKCLAKYVYKQSVVESEKEGVLKHLEIAIQFLGKMAEETNDKALSRVLVDEYIDELNGIGEELKEFEFKGERESE